MAVGSFFETINFGSAEILSKPVSQVAGVPPHPDSCASRGRVWFASGAHPLMELFVASKAGTTARLSSSGACFPCTVEIVFESSVALSYQPVLSPRYVWANTQGFFLSLPAVQSFDPTKTKTCNLSSRSLPCCAAAPAKAAEPSPEAQAALAALPPTERLLADVQAAFEAAEVPMSDYTSLDAAGLACLLPPSVVARSARLFLEEKTAQWACRQVVYCC